MPRRLLPLLALIIATTACAAGSTSEPAGAVEADSGAAPSVVSPSTTVTTAAAPTTTQAASTTSPASTTAAPSTTTTTTTTTTALVPLEQLELSLTEIASGFEQPVYVTSAPGDERLYVVDQPGRIWTIADDQIEVFLDIRERVTFGGERGLLGLAFPADHDSSGVLYVHYVGSGNETHIASFRSDGAVADPASEQVILRIVQPASNHNGGMIEFGPDGYLWIGMGDGGGRNDRYNQGQAADTLLGAMLRIDVRPDGYEIPPDNPAATDAAFAAEVWAIGLRNPWRFSFDGDAVWIGDVGQGAVEEINQVDAAAAGLNYGWPLFEGSACYFSDCDDTGLTPPVTEYSHADGCSVTGGVVYRGGEIPELDGHYLYGDFCGGWVRSFSPTGDTWEWFGAGSVGGLASFGTDADGEVYVVSTNGNIFRIDRS